MPHTTQPTENVSPSSAVNQLAGQLTIYQDVGLDTEGRAHFFEPGDRHIIVTATDRRGQGVRDSDVIKRVPVGEQTVDDYCEYVREHVDDLDWIECDWQVED